MQSAPTKKCPFCGEQIHAEAIKCRFCKEFLEDDNALPISHHAKSAGAAGPAYFRGRSAETADVPNSS